MTYQISEISNYDAQPIELFRFSQDANSWHYCSGESEFTYNSEIYRPTPITRTAPELSQQRGSSGITVTVPRDNEVAGLFRVFIPRSSVWLTIYRVHEGDDEVFIFWQGRIRAVNWSGSKAEIACEPMTAMLKREGPRLLYQGLCNHMLFDRNCQVSAEQYKTEIKVTKIEESGYQIMAHELQAKDDGWFTAGFLSRDNGQDFRMVINHVGDTVTLLLPFEDLQLKDKLFAFSGCDHSISTCSDKFQNAINFGGFPYIPTKNPFQTGIE